MHCRESQELLQRLLDGEAISEGAGLKSHLASCAACRGMHAAAGRLAEGVRRLSGPVVPPDLKAKLVSCLLTDRRRRQRRRYALAGLAAAAAVLLAVWVPSGSDSDQPEKGPATQIALPAATSTPAPTAAVPPVAPAALSLRHSLAEAEAAVVALTRRTGAETVEPTRLLTSTLPTALPLAVFEALPPPTPEQPPITTLQETGQLVVSGLEPVTNSAVRAFRLFTRRTPAKPENP